MNRRKRSSSPQSYAKLESRQLLAGGVYVNLSGSSLTVVGNALDNSFAINLNARTPELLVQGQDDTSIRFSDSFSNGFNPADISDVFVFSNAGNDTVTIDGRSNQLRGDLVVSLGHGDDSLYLFGGRFAGNATLYAGTDHDTISIAQTSFGGNLALIAGSGTDVAALDSATVSGETRFLGQFGHDTMLVLDSNFGQNAYIELGDGADRFESLGSDYANRISVRGRLGFDTAMLHQSNSFSGGAFQQTIEAETLLPNENGAVDDSIGQLKDSFFDIGSELRSFTSQSIHDQMNQFAINFNAQLASLEVDVESQYVTVADATPTVSIMWDRAVQEAVIATSPGPTIASRAYAMMHTAMYDAWSAYDETAISTQLGDQLQRPQSENTDRNKKVAMSFAAYRVLEDLFADQKETFDSLMSEFGFNPANRSLDASTPAGVGNRMAQALLAYRHTDGSNQLGNDPQGEAGVPYSDTFGYTSENQPGAVVDIESWAPEFVPIDASPGTAERTQEFLTPHWGGVNTFSLSSGDQFRPPAPEPFLLVDGTVNLPAKTITLAGGEEVAIDKSLIGTVINPGFISQAEEVVQYSANLTDEHKLIAEFWEDGGGTSFPPGTFMTFGQYVSARDMHSVDDDAKLFFALGNAVFDAGVATWEAKYHYDYVRPVRAIRDLGELGLIGEFDESLGGHAIDAWTPGGGTQKILATEFLTYQTPGSDPSPPFAEYTSGHSAFSAAGAAILELFTGSDEFGASITFEAGTSRFEPGLTPSSQLTLSWDTFSAAADEAGLSRLYGGIHFTDGDIHGRTLGENVGQSAFDRAQDFINGTG